MLNHSGIGQYLDAESLCEFASRIIEILPETQSIAVLDAAGPLVWCGPDQDDARLWPAVQAHLAPASSTDRCVELDSGKRLYQFCLRQTASGDSAGTVALLTHRDVGLLLAQVRSEIDEIISCIVKQLDIRLELSGVRQQSGRERQDMQLLSQLDELLRQDYQGNAIQKGLDTIGRHFGSKLAVIEVPNQGVRHAWRPDGDVSAANCEAMAPILSSLLTAARQRGRVLIADAAGVLQRFARIDGDANLLSAPVLDDSDAVVGVLALVSTTKFSRYDVRLIRVVASRVAALLTQQDPATAAPGTRHELLQEMDKQLQSDRTVHRALLLIDIDKLHVINEMHGHFGGDAAIARVSEVAKKHAGTSGLSCNISGGSIALYLPQSDEQNAVACADAIREALHKNPAVYEGRTVEISASIGVAMMPIAAQDAPSALNIAEVASRSAKARGGDQTVVFDDLDASVMRRREDLNQVGELQAALLDNRFVLYGQQIVALQEENTRPRYEVLLRMLDERGNVLSPDRFLSAAERYQMMTSIDRWVVRETTNMLRNADNQLEINLASFSINVSTQSMMDEDFAGFVEQQVIESGIAPDTFCFEITETSVIRDLHRAQELLRRLRRLGCRLALDDFGTGQCSFAYLKDIPVQYIKIDGAFIRDILDNPLSLAIVESVAKIGKVINAHTVAEYVETEHILDCVRTAGIDFAQGYRIGKPRPLTEILDGFGAPMISEADLLQANA